MPLELFAMVALSGIVATYGLLIMALWAPRLGLPRLDFSRAMAELSYGESFEGAAPYWAGQKVIYLNGIFFALIYATVVAPLLPGEEILRGVFWGLVLFVASGVFFVPLFLREGFFLWHIDRKAWITSLMVHGVYGLILGWLSPIAGHAGW
jgi:hypothetical protein